MNVCLSNNSNHLTWITGHTVVHRAFVPNRRSDRNFR